MLEAESLGPLVKLDRGAKVEHVEKWELFKGVAAVTDDASADKNVLPLVKGK